MISTASINSTPLATAPESATGGKGSAAYANATLIASAIPIPPLTELVTTQRDIIVFAVEIYPAFLPGRSK